jgi:alpha-D-ribose 1-methylphosphonate 5-triphosphate synthase subunit PhnI
LKNNNTTSSNFLISIYHQENHSWQGVIQWLDTGEKIHFRSELEMLQLIQSAVRVNSESNEEVRNWNEVKNIKIAK